MWYLIASGSTQNAPSPWKPVEDLEVPSTYEPTSGEVIDLQVKLLKLLRAEPRGNAQFQGNPLNCELVRAKPAEANDRLIDVRSLSVTYVTAWVYVFTTTKVLMVAGTPLC